jgi:hypothetical protein
MNNDEILNNTVYKPVTNTIVINPNFDLSFNSGKETIPPGNTVPTSSIQSIPSDSGRLGPTRRYLYRHQALRKETKETVVAQSNNITHTILTHTPILHTPIPTTPPILTPPILTPPILNKTQQETTATPGIVATGKHNLVNSPVTKEELITT